MTLRSLGMSLLVSVSVLGSAGCTFVSKSTEFNGVPSPNGKAVEYYEATRVGAYFLFVFPLTGWVDSPKTIDDLTAQIKEENGKTVRIVQSSRSILWYVLLPISIFVHPVIASVSAEVEVDPRPAPPEVEEDAAGASATDGAEADGATEADESSES